MSRFTIKKQAPTPEEFVSLRARAGLSPRSLESVRMGLPNSWYAVSVFTDTGEIIAMGRIVGDGGTTFSVCDIAVLPHYQGQGIGRLIMKELMDHFTEDAPIDAHLNLLADGDAKYLYEKFGFRESAPASVGMVFKRELYR